MSQRGQVLRTISRLRGQPQEVEERGAERLAPVCCVGRAFGVRKAHVTPSVDETKKEPASEKAVDTSGSHGYIALG
jgi:hypothetical protein